jgi:D-alanyl-D-alanine carboxypeptidase
MVTSVLFLATLVQPDKVDDIATKAMKDMKIPGLAVMVLKDGKPIKTKGYGFANLEHRVPVKPETIFQSGSVGKMFTATLIMMLVEEGKLKLDESIGKYFPEAKGAWDEVLLRHLLTHTSGLGQLPYIEMDLQKNHTEDEQVKVMVAQKPVAKPGDEWAYNNGGYVMLGILVRRVTGKFYGDLMQEKIFKPAGMTTARVISEADIIPNRAAGYVLTENGIKNQDWVAPVTNTTADGALYLSLLDFAKWDVALYGTKLLKQSTLEQMWAPTKLNDGQRTALYGFGWFTRKVGDKRLIDHSGAWQGFTAYIGRHVDQRVTVVVLANLDGWNAKCSEIGRAILKLYVP